MKTTRIDGSLNVIETMKNFAAENPRGFFTATEKDGIKTNFYVERNQLQSAIDHWRGLKFSSRKSLTATA
jgi:hypothetical protein